MASAAPSVDMEEEATCSICLECLKDPVTLDCGHNFCRSCVAGYCEKWKGLEVGSLTCPVCKAKIQKGNFQTNWQLANIVEKIKLVQINKNKVLPKSSREENLCLRHKEKLHLFCKEDKESVCWRCKRSPEHSDHSVLLLEEATEEYKGQLCSSLEMLRKEREEILLCKANIEKESQELLVSIINDDCKVKRYLNPYLEKETMRCKQTERERQRTVAHFRQLRELLETEEKRLLAQMEEVKKEIERKRDDHMANISRELSSLEGIIQETEEKCEQPTRELLQDVGNTLQRCEQKEAFEVPVAFPPVLKWKIWDFCDLNPFLEGIMKEFKDTLISGLQLQKANVVLDPDTAHPNLILSEDQKSVRRGAKCQDLPDNPERFDYYGVVLGLDGFTGGRHFWEVTVGSEGGWSVGVARKSVRRKGDGGLDPEQGIWQMGKWKGCYRDEIWRPLPILDPEPRRIRVSLNCAGRRLAFFDADTAALICVSSEAPFFAETILPFFWVYQKGQLRLSL